MNPSKSQSSAHCHKQIAKTAKGLADQNYDELMSSDWIYAEWKRKHPGMGSKGLRRAFVSAKWGLYVPAARATLAALLREPIDEALKEEIMEALVLDSTLLKGRAAPMRVVGEMKQGN